MKRCWTELDYEPLRTWALLPSSVRPPGLAQILRGGVQLLDMVENSSSLCKSSLGWFFRQCAVRTSYLTLE
jgi:hypothetical protein